MSRKTTFVNDSEIKKSFTTTASVRASSRCKADFKLKRFTGTKTEFGVATLCAGSVFGLSGLKD